MRVLHTSDWHLGRTIRRRQRLDEARAVLNEIVDIAKDEEVDLVLVCGDIYESFAPSAEAEQILYDTLLSLSKAEIPVVALAGNHDYARRFEAVKALLHAIEVQVCPWPVGPTDGGVLEVPSREGSEVAQVAVLPWVSERALFGAEEMMGLEGAPYQAYAERVPPLLNALCDVFDPEKVNILAGHLFIGGSRPGGGERELTIGEIFAISAASLPTSPQYIALGHVHRPQDVRGASVPTRYSGSTLQLDFGEAGQAKSITLVDLTPGKPAQTREVKLTAGRKLVDVEVSLDAIESVEVDPEAYLRVLLECEGPVPGLVDRVRDVLPNAVEVRLVYEREDPAKREAELRTMTPTQQFQRYYQRQHGSKPDKKVTKLFEELLEEVRDAPVAD